MHDRLDGAGNLVGLAPLLGPGLDRGGNDGGIGRVRHQATTELFADIPRGRGMIGHQIEHTPAIGQG